MNAKSLSKMVLFVCTGNTCRSPMAEKLLKAELKNSMTKLSQSYKVTSAGLMASEGENISDNARQALKKLGISNVRHKSKQVTLKMLEKSDYVICMTFSHMQAIKASGYKGKITTIGEIVNAHDVPDPYGCGLPEYLNAAKYLQYATVEIINYLENN